MHEEPLSITIKPTPEIIIYAGFPVRVWDGLTDKGASCKVLVALVGLDAKADQSPFERELVPVSGPPDG